MFLVPGILGQFALDEELIKAGGGEYLSDVLLTQIGMALPDAVKAFEAKGGGSYIKVYPRNKLHWAWRGKKVKMWRLTHLWQNPLWLGEDGVIYRGEGPLAFDHRPDFCQRAEIELRGLDGLQRVLDALTINHPCGPTGAPVEMSPQGNGAEI